MGKVIYYPSKDAPVAEALSLMVQSEENIVASGLNVPNVSAEQVIDAYNAVVSGRGATIVDKDGVGHFEVNQADSLNNEISIEIIFYNSALLTYTVIEDMVTITVTNL